MKFEVQLNGKVSAIFLEDGQMNYIGWRSGNRQRRVGRLRVL
jgi:hypothetical protein